MKLLNENDEQRVTLRLNKDVEREFQLRLFLDSNVSYGINRKEMILQMYQALLDNGFIGEDQRLKSSPMTQEQVSIVKTANEERYKDSIKSEAQGDKDSVDASDFDML